MKIQATVVFQKNWEANKRIIVNQGSSRSSKTYSIAQKYILKLLKEKGKILSIVRKTSPALDLTVARDFFEILINWNLYDSKNHNKTLKTYNLNGNLVEFLGMDNPQKKRGAKRDYLWLNEANELSVEDWRQLAMRTTGEITLDFNPSDSFHWIYDDVMTREDCQIIKSTYKDNPFLPKEVIDEIERYQVLDPNFWRVFGLGERGVSEDLIYTHWQRCETLPESYDRRYYGADWGFNNQTAIVEVREKDNVLYAQELLYQSGLNSDEIIRKLQELNIPRDAVIVGDSEDPGKINDIYMAGYNIKPAYKNKGSVIRGINAVKVKELHITNTSINMIKELQFYRWQKNKDGQTMDMPIKVKDHIMDAMRYCIDYMELEKATDGKIYNNKPFGF
jgi:phage terminase large subunit